MTIVLSGTIWSWVGIAINLTCGFVNVGSSLYFRRRFKRFSRVNERERASRAAEKEAAIRQWEVVQIARHIAENGDRHYNIEFLKRAIEQLDHSEQEAGNRAFEYIVSAEGELGFLRKTQKG